MKTVGLLLVGHVDLASLHVGGDYPELFSELLAPVGLRVQAFSCDQGDTPASLGDCDAWLCSPSRASVYDGHGWIAAVEDIVRECVATETPYIGICFGHQLLAQALGGTVEIAASGWGIGAKDYDIVNPQPWMQPATTSLRLAASHQDQVLTQPANTDVIASSDYCPIGGLRAGERAWSLQAHPEFSPALADSLLASRVSLFGEERAQEARATLSQPLDRDVFAQWTAAFVGR